jgi:DMSO/TMAO reductase YedYZ molybdopterin-dependent catalytic subunit
VSRWSCIGKWEGVRLAALLHLVGLRPTARRFACAMSGNSATRWPNTSMRIELVEDFARIGDGNGGYWEDQGYEWWAGI